MPMPVSPWVTVPTFGLLAASPSMFLVLPLSLMPRRLVLLVLVLVLLVVCVRGDNPGKKDSDQKP